MDSQEWEDFKVRAAESFARECADAHAAAERSRERMEEARYAVDGIKAVRYDAIGGGSMEHGDDAISARVERLQAAIGRYAERMLMWLDVAEVMERSLERVPDQRHRRVVTKRYLTGMAWADIEQEEHYSHSMMMVLRRDALLSLYDAMPERYRLAIPDALE